MLKSKTHFEQVPLETVRKIVREQIQREAMNNDGIKEEMLESSSRRGGAIHGGRTKFSDEE